MRARRFAIPVPTTFAQPPNMREANSEVFAGEYDVDVTFPDPPRILDIGACCGAFAVWAARRWPGAVITCYEPNPAAYDFLQKNTIRTLEPPFDNKRVAWTVNHNMGVMRSRGILPLYSGANNLGEASFYKGEEQGPKARDVEVIAACDLPGCDILKVDAEGAEFEILGGYLNEEKNPTVVMLEFHNMHDRVLLDAMLRETFYYVLMRGEIHSPDRGTLVYVKREIWEASL